MTDVLRNRFLIYQLVRTELRGEFRRTFFGLAWLLLVPLVAVMVWILLNQAGIVEPGDTGVPYPAYVLLSTSIWGFFAESYRACGRLLEIHGRLLLSTPFPVEVLIAKAIVIHSIRFLIPLFLNVMVLLAFGIRFHPLALLFPFALLPLLCAGCGLGLLIAPFRLIVADVSRLSDEGMRLLMYLTPVVYAPKIALGPLGVIVALNPLTYLVGFPRDLLTRGTLYEPISFVGWALAGVSFFILSAWMFRRVEPRLRERLLAN